MDYSFSTTNESFIGMSKILQEKGVEDYIMPLIVLDDDLIGIDPFNEDLNVVLQEKVINECRKNPWYFFRECVKISDIQGTRRFELHMGAYALIEMILDDSNKHILYKAPRQTHATLNIQLILLYYCFSGRGVIPFVGKSKESKWNMVKRIMNLVSFPHYMQGEILSSLNSLCNAVIIDGLFIEESTYTKREMDVIETVNRTSHNNTRIIGIQSYHTTTDTSFERWELGKVKYQDHTVMIFITMEDLNLGKDWYEEMCALLHNDPEAIKKEIELI